MNDQSPPFQKLVEPPIDSALEIEPKHQHLELLWGAVRIAAELNVTTRRAFYLLEHGEIPAQKVGGRWCTTRNALRKRFGVE